MIEKSKIITPSPSHNEAASRFEIVKESYMAVLEYELQDGIIVFTHTGVPAALEGQGIGSRLAQAGLEYARAAGLKVVPLCSFISAYMHKHPEYSDLV